MSIVKRTDGVRAPVPAKEPSLATPAFVFSGLFMLAGLAVSLWLCQTAKSASTLQVTAPAGLGAVAAIVAAALGLRSWQKAWKQRLVAQQEENRRALNTAQMQISELQTISYTTERVETENTQLAQAKAQLEAELNTL